MADATPNGHDPRIDALIEAAAQARRDLAETNRTVAVLIDAVADTNRNVAALTGDIASLTRVVRLHLIHDHGYEDLGEGGDDGDDG